MLYLYVFSVQSLTQYSHSITGFISIDLNNCYFKINELQIYNKSYWKMSTRHLHILHNIELNKSNYRYNFKISVVRVQPHLSVVEINAIEPLRILFFISISTFLYSALISYSLFNKNESPYI